MPSGVRPAHQHRISDLLSVQVLRDGTGVIALDCQIEEPCGADKRRGSVWPLDLLAVDRRMKIEKIAGQHIQRGIDRKLETECLRVMGVRLEVGQLVRSGRFGLDASDGFHDQGRIIRGHKERCNACSIPSLPKCVGRARQRHSATWKGKSRR